MLLVREGRPVGISLHPPGPPFMEHVMGRLPNSLSENRRKELNRPPVEVAAFVDTVVSPTIPRAWNKHARGWYYSLRKSAQSRLYQPSDWHTAILAAHILHEYHQAAASDKPRLLSHFRYLVDELGATVAARHKLKIEITSPALARDPVDFTEVKQRFA